MGTSAAAGHLNDMQSNALGKIVTIHGHPSHDDETDIRIPRQSLDAHIVNAQCVQQGLRFAGPNWIIEFIECQYCSFGHARYKVLERNFGGLIKVKVQK